ncbi:hypothetical protein HDU79_010481 [Rhizoclosmatium sp. JEL0117]|nr:hypothetical protein HDU79_010481 [Rhizoclosmatium sp. JEL0117]
MARHKERNMNQVKEGDKMYFVADAFLEEWTQFLLGNKMPGSSVDNSSLILPLNHWDLVGLPAGLDNGLPLVHPGIVPFHNFGLVSEATWNYLVEEYGGGPTLSEANIPLNSVMYEPLLRMMEIAKQRIIDFYDEDEIEDDSE